ncbi:AgmX/PglI C-terminal domain-containing protein [Candidatus Peregrinibacteria bacterium]|nr:AgmX/PglI C-terminal domain-containing protein [Candidatus Peregrinibacteria bacterium]
MNPLESNQSVSLPLPEGADDRLAKPKNRLTLNLGKWGNRLAVLFVLKGWLGMTGCAATQVKPNAEAQDADPKQTLLRAIQAAEEGAQPDGSEVQFGEGASEEEAIANAKALVEMLVEGNLVFESHNTPLPSGRFLAVTRGKAEKKTGPDPEIIKKRLLAKLNVKKDGAQKDGSEVQFGEGASEEEAIANAKALVEMLFDAKNITYINRSERFGSKWMAVVRGMEYKPQKKHTGPRGMEDAMNTSSIDMPETKGVVTKAKNPEKKSEKSPKELMREALLSNDLPSGNEARTKALIRRSQPFFKSKYEKELKRNPEMKGGKLIVKFNVSASGKVWNIRFIYEGKMEKNERLEKHFRGIVSTWRYPKQETPTAISFPLLLGSY